MRTATIVVVLAGLASPAWALDAPDAPNATDATNAPTPDAAAPELQLDLGLSVVGLAYEQPVAEHFAVQAELDSTLTWFAPTFSAGQSVGGVAAGLRGSWFSRRDHSGLYIAPYVRVARLYLADQSNNGISGGAWVGWAWRVTRRIDIRVGAGAQYIDYRVRDGGSNQGMDTPFFALDGVVGFRL